MALVTQSYDDITNVWGPPVILLSFLLPSVLLHPLTRRPERRLQPRRPAPPHVPPFSRRRRFASCLHRRSAFCLRRRSASPSPSRVAARRRPPPLRGAGIAPPRSAEPASPLLALRRPRRHLASSPSPAPSQVRRTRPPDLRGPTHTC